MSAAPRRASTIGELGESRLIAEIRRWLGDVCPPAPRGIGDDCAIARVSGAEILLTVDPVIAGRHFDAATPASAVAAKLLKRNLSDIAAMGGRPRSALVAIAAPADLPVAWLRHFYRGLAREARRFDVQVVGGDCAQTPGPFSAFLTLNGDAPARPLTRSGARVGDVLFVTGELGGSILGKHLRFTPRLVEGAWLARRAHVHAAMDVSDGLGKDLPALVPREAGAVIETPALPVSAAARRLARREQRHPLDCALNDGEDYELVFAVARSGAARLETAWRKSFRTPLSRIGRLERIQPHLRGAATVPVRFEPPLPDGVRVRGYEHFR